MASQSPVIRLDPVRYGALDFDGVNAAETLYGDICLSTSRKAFSAFEQPENEWRFDRKPQLRSARLMKSVWCL